MIQVTPSKGGGVGRGQLCNRQGQARSSLLHSAGRDDKRKYCKGAGTGQRQVPRKETKRRRNTVTKEGKKRPAERANVKQACGREKTNGPACRNKRVTRTCIDALMFNGGNPKWLKKHRKSTFGHAHKKQEGGAAPSELRDSRGVW